jgi:hypothetical protein
MNFVPGTNGSILLLSLGVLGKLLLSKAVNRKQDGGGGRV